jgi:hypothetical protein
MAELELITMGESASQAEFNNTSDLLTGAQKPGFSMMGSRESGVVRWGMWNYWP